MSEAMKALGKDEAPELPVDSFREAAPILRRPFTPAAVKFKVQATWETGALIVAYIDARLAVERLNLVCPHLWHDEYRPIGQGLMWCDLTVDGITRSDVGEGTGKGLVSDALKRAAVKFGVAVSLYAIPSVMLNNDMLKRKTKTRRGEQVEEVTLTEQGEKHVRGLYAQWLNEHGRESFGEPLSHGDVEGAQGDPEADPQVPEGVDPQTGEITVDTISSSDAKHLWNEADSAGIDETEVERACAHYSKGRALHVDELTGPEALQFGEWVERKRAARDDAAAREAMDLIKADEGTLPA